MDREKKIDELYDQIEQDVAILGATAIEDKLQEDVGNLLPHLGMILNCNVIVDETIHFMRKTDIKVWVLTGDKIGTARSIAMACKLIEPHMKELFIDGKTEADVLHTIQKAKRVVTESASDPKYCMVTGDAMLVIAKNHPLEKEVDIIRFWEPISLKSLLVYSHF